MAISKAITFTAFGPRNDAGGQLKLPEMPDALTSASPLPSLCANHSPLGGFHGGTGTGGHW